MSLETILAYALAVIGVLLSMLIALVVYVFVSLKSEVLGVKGDIGELSRNRAKLVHKDECRATTSRIHSRLDEHETDLHQLNERMTRAETLLQLKEH